MKFIVIFSLFIPAPLILAGEMLYLTFVDTLISNNTNKNLQLTELIAKKIDENVLRYIYSASSIISENNTMNASPSIIGNINKWRAATDDYQKLMLSLQINSQLSYFFNYTTDLTGITFIFKDNGYYTYNAPIPVEPALLKSASWYSNMKENNESIRVLGRLKNSLYTGSRDNGEYSIAIASFVNNAAYVNPSEVELIYITFKENTFEKVYSGIQLSKVGRIDILTPEGEPVSSKDDKITSIQRQQHLFSKDYGSLNYHLDNDKLLMTYYTVPSTHWKVVNTISYNELTQDVNRVMLIIIGVFAFIILLFVTVFFTSITKTVVNPVKKLIRQMSLVEKGDLNTLVPVHGQDELALLNKTFNRMVGEINNLITNIDMEKTERLQLEIKSLQYQINPHFLLNTLNSITMMADIHGVDNIKMMTDALSKLLNNTLSRDGVYTTIAGEYEILQSYAYFMKFRYGDRFDITFHVPPEISQCYMLKLLLQPIVENSILHGMVDVFEKLEIGIFARQVGQSLEIRVVDNGIGMTPIQAAGLVQNRRETNSNHGFNKIGVNNVHQRIKLNFGEAYGLTIQSEQGKGTTVILTLPLINDDSLPTRSAAYA